MERTFRSARHFPSGISFFTFQSLSYTLDVYRGDLKPLSSLLDYAFYVSFFPQLVAGPIVRARDFVPQIRQPLTVTNEMFGQGIFFIVSGLFKKAVISDYISINFVERIFDNPGLYSGIENFPINFNSPYKSDSVTDFWHRWHISLSTWLRDYLYISMGGNRKGKIRTYINLIVTMLLGGLWHGASWNFILWGGLHGAALAIHKFLRSLLHRPKTLLLLDILPQYDFRRFADHDTANLHVFPSRTVHAVGYGILESVCVDGLGLCASLVARQLARYV